MKYCILVGNPFKGYDIYGPYITEQEAADACEAHEFGDEDDVYVTHLRPLP